jgi:uncharacterized protein (TIGR02145 family)
MTDKKGSFKEKVIYAVIAGVLIFVIQELLKPYISNSKNETTIDLKGEKFLGILAEADDLIRKTPPNFEKAKVLYESAINYGNQNKINTVKAEEGLKLCNDNLAEPNIDSYSYEDRLWEKAISQKKYQYYIDYLKLFPSGHYVKKARIQLDQLDKNQTDGNSGKLIDERDGITYGTIKINGKIWMAQNLRFSVKGSWCYKKENGERDCNNGRLYSLESLEDVCPNGWHLPSDDEWIDLLVRFGGYFDLTIQREFGNSKKSFESLFKNGESGFNADYTGFKYKENFVMREEGLGVFYWSSTMADFPWQRYAFSFNNSQIGTPMNSTFRYIETSESSLACRCVKN